jgi:hypothetical protein
VEVSQVMYGHIPWPPRVGDMVHVKGAGVFGEVRAIEGEGEDQRFILDVHPQASASVAGALRNAADAASAPHDYALDELEPNL